MCDFQSTISCLCSRFSHSYNLPEISQVNLPKGSLYLKALQPCAMTFSILNNTNKSNYRKYECGELLIFVKIFHYKTAYEGGISGWNRLFLYHLKAKRWGKGNVKILQIYPASWRILFSVAKDRLCWCWLG